MKRAFATFALLLCMMLPIKAQEYTGYNTVVKSVRPIQAINVEKGTLDNICTATSINTPKQYWLTAGHCVGEQDVALFVDGHMAVPVFVDHVADLAVLQTSDLSVPSLKLRTDVPGIEQKIKIIGYPVGLPQVQVFHGRVSSLRTWVDDGNYMTFDMTACGGNSGSAVVDEDDRVLSVLQIGWGRGCSSFSGGAPWDVLARLVGKFFKR